MDAQLALLAWKPRATALAAALEAHGVLPDPAWLAAFTEVPRHVFVPRVMLDAGQSLEAGEPEWLDMVYSDESLRTQIIAVGEGMNRQEIPTSSSSKPEVMAVMLDRLNVQTGHRVLEIGTGTGYNTALLSHRLGPENVYSIDIDPNLINLARTRLSEIDLHPHLAAGDGANGWADDGPFDRIIATCAITHIPSAWIDQLADGGRIVAPLDAGDAGPLLVLDKTKPHEVTGRIDPYPAHFMPLRASADNPLGPGHSIGFTGTGRSHYGTTSLDPSTLFSTGSTDLALFLWLHSPGLRLAFARELGRVYVHTATSLAEVETVASDENTWTVKQSGSLRLWDTVEHAYDAWLSLGKPGPARLSITAPTTVDEQFAWLDDPDGTHSWPLPSHPSGS